MSLRELGKRLSNIPTKAVLQKQKLPLEGGNEGAFRTIENAQYDRDGIDKFIKQRGGTKWLKNFFGKIINLYGFIDPLGSGHDFMVVQTSSGKVYLYNINLDDSNEIDDIDTSEPLFFLLVGAYLYYFSDDGEIQRYYNIRLDTADDYGIQYPVMVDKVTPKVLKGDKAVAGTVASGEQVLDTLGNTIGNVTFTMAGGGFGNEAFVNFDPAVHTTKYAFVTHIVDTLNGNSDFQYTAEYVTFDTFKLYSNNITASELDVTVAIDVGATNSAFTASNLTGASFIDTEIPDADINFDYDKISPLSTKAYALIEVYDDGSVSAISHPQVVLNEWYQDKFSDEDILLETETDWVDRVVIEYPATAQPNCAKRYLLATPWIQSNEEPPANPPYPVNTVEDQYYMLLNEYTQFSDLLTPSSPDYPIGMWYVVKEIGLSAGTHTDNAKDSKIGLRPVASLGYETSGGVSDTLIRGQVRPRSVSSIKGAVIIGGYDQKRLAFSTNAGELDSNAKDHFPKSARVEVYEGRGLQDGFPEWVIGFQMEYSDGAFSQIFAHTEKRADGTVNTLNRFNKYSMSGFNNQIKGMNAVACKLSGERWRFGGFQFEGDVFATWTGTPLNDNDGLGDYAIIAMKIDSDTLQIFRIYNVGSINSVETALAILQLNLEEEGYNVIARADAVGDWYIQSSNPDTRVQKLEILVTSDPEDFFYNLEVTTGQTVTYTGTTVETINKDFRLLGEHKIEDPQMHGLPVVRQDLTDVADVEALDSLDFANQRLAEDVNLRSRIMTCVPAQSQNINRQTRIVDQSEIVNIAPIDLDVQEAIRYKLVVWTNQNTQTGYVVDAGSGADVYFDGEFEVKHYGETLRGRDSFHRYRDGLIYQTVDSVYLFTTATGFKRILENDRYPESKGEMVSGAFDGQDGNIWLLFKDSKRLLLVDEFSGEVTFANFANIPNVTLQNVTDIGGEVYLATTSGSNYALCLANQSDMIVDEYGDGQDERFIIAMETGYIATDAERVKVQEIQIGGQGYSARIFIDLQKSRRYKSSRVWNRDFTKDVTLPAKTLRMYNTVWRVGQKGVMPRIRIEMDAEFDAFIDDIEVHYSITENENKASE